ncbi:hypothetical protein KOI35_11515 [Actinoplanes bogorensis]|uniref:Uncharacterized protein n=1 Tax=Paractinoplanes bogorensis TaxID=1610840 RepID=A0ABS5YKX9_9ACTN|nr:hypothetical protein [Actinoplanes bogorensis]MBU2664120.1 hypothetical protein [Actinoplanes bogorensis]
MIETAETTARLRAHGELTAAEEGDELLSVSVGPDGEAVALWSAKADREALSAVTVQPGFATFPDARAARPAPARVTVHSPGLDRVVRISDLPLAHATAQPLPDGRVLVVAARCRWRPEGADRNAIVYDADGTVVAEHTFGDGIEDVFTTPSGDAWAGYFDEGVVGNYGWGSAPGPEPIGQCGLIRFGPDGEPDWRFPMDDAPGITDCYALNVTGETAWACYYTDFPLVRVEGGQVTVWRNGLVRGALSLIVDGDRVGLYGGYDSGAGRLVIGQVSEGGGELTETGRHRLTLPGGEPLPDRIRTVGRGAALHVFHGTTWYRLSLDETK